MATEDGETRKAFTREGNTEEHALDTLARVLADGTVSRGRALKLVGAALLGALVPFALSPAEASGQSSGGSGGSSGGGGRHRNRRRSFCPGASTKCGPEGERFCCPPEADCVEGVECICPGQRQLCGTGKHRTCCEQGEVCDEKTGECVPVQPV